MVHLVRILPTTFFTGTTSELITKMFISVELKENHTSIDLNAAIDAFYKLVHDMCKPKATMHLQLHQIKRNQLYQHLSEKLLLRFGPDRQKRRWRDRSMT